MARPLRIQFENAYYHVTCRGNARQDIFNNEIDYATFLELLARSSEIYGVEILGYVLMRNHFHLLLRTPRANLQEFMRHFNISYTSYFNRRYHRPGHLFQGRYKSFLIDADSYLLAALRYVHLNPVHVSDMKDLTLSEKMRYLDGYQWSSYPGYTRQDNQSPLVHYDILDMFGADTPTRYESYKRFVEAGLAGGFENPFQKGAPHGVVGDDEFIQSVR
jgi:putative transposase